MLSLVELKDGEIIVKTRFKPTSLILKILMNQRLKTK